jgi:hypothetical protein
MGAGYVVPHIFYEANRLDSLPVHVGTCDLHIAAWDWYLYKGLKLNQYRKTVFLFRNRHFAFRINVKCPQFSRYLLVIVDQKTG